MLIPAAPLVFTSPVKVVTPLPAPVSEFVRATEAAVIVELAVTVPEVVDKVTAPVRVITPTAPSVMVAVVVVKETVSAPVGSRAPSVNAPVVVFPTKLLPAASLIVPVVKIMLTAFVAVLKVVVTPAFIKKLCPAWAV
jgi:hypothetical protein